MKIVVVSEETPLGKRTGEFKAFPEGSPQIWGRGNSMREAVAALIFDHQPTLGLVIDFQGSQRLA